MANFSDIIFPSNLSSAGYQKLPSGLIIQWGSSLVSAGSFVDFTLPITYPTTYQATVMLDFDGTVDSSGIRSHIVSNSVLRLYNADTGGDYIIRFITVGY